MTENKTRNLKMIVDRAENFCDDFVDTKYKATAFGVLLRWDLEGGAIPTNYVFPNLNKVINEVADELEKKDKLSFEEGIFIVELKKRLGL